MGVAPVVVQGHVMEAVLEDAAPLAQDRVMAPRSVRAVKTERVQPVALEPVPAVRAEVIAAKNVKAIVQLL